MLALKAKTFKLRTVATHSTGNSKSKTVSMEPELLEKTKTKWGDGKKFRTFSAYVRKLIRIDLGFEYPENEEGAVSSADEAKGNYLAADRKKQKP